MVSRALPAMLRLSFPLRTTAAAAAAGSYAYRFSPTTVPSLSFSAAAAQPEDIAREMARYAFSLVRSGRSAESHGQGMLVLEQGLSNFQSNLGDSGDEASGTLLLAMSTLLYRWGEMEDAKDKLRMAYKLPHASPALKVAACEGLVGLYLEEDQDLSADTDDCFQCLKKRPMKDASMSAVTNLRVKSIKGLVDLVQGNENLAQSSFDSCDTCNFTDNSNELGNVALSYGEFYHVSGEFSLARDFYKKALQGFAEKDNSYSLYVSAANMAYEEVLVGAACGLGQLLSHSGEFNEAEEMLTKALTKAENHYGLTNPKVAAILTCIAIMYGHKARLEASSSLVIQEGLYRKALDLLKAPSLDSCAKLLDGNKRELIALARGGYGDILYVQQNRKSEGEHMKKWAEDSWNNHRVSLAQALHFAESTKPAVVDTRVLRVL